MRPIGKREQINVMKYILIISFIISQNAVGQQWYSAKDTLKLPPSPGGIYNNSGYIKRYDTVPAIYILSGDTLVRKGFKMVFISHGFYIDDSLTFGEFFDDKKKRIKNIDGYGFL